MSGRVGLHDQEECPINEDNPLPVKGVMQDIELGAVEIKDADSDDRLTVNSDGSINVNSALSGGTVYTVPPFTVTKTYVGNQFDEILVTPSAGKSLQIIGVMITSNDSIFTCTVEFKTSNIIIQEHYEQGTLGSYLPSNLTGGIDEELTIRITDSDLSKRWFVIVNFEEV